MSSRKLKSPWGHRIGHDWVTELTEMKGLKTTRFAEELLPGSNGYHNKYHRLGGLSNRNLLPHSSGGLKCETNVLAVLLFSWSFSPWLMDGSILCFSSHISLCTVWVISSSHKDNRHIGLGLTLKTLFYLDYLFINSVSKYSRSTEVQGIRTAT